MRAAFATQADQLTLDVLRRKRSAKWAEVSGDVLPASVADPDLPLAPPVRAALLAAIELGDIGHMPEDPAPARAWAEWCERRHGWLPDISHTSAHGNVVAALSACIELLSKPGDPVLVPVPAYPPFRLAVTDLGRRPIEVPLTADSTGRSTFDLEAMADVMRGGARMVLLCSPHNPTGRAWTTVELEAIAELVLTHGGWLVSDEVFADLALPGSQHVPTASLAPEVAARTVTLASASKAFGTAGLKYALAVAPDAELDQRMQHRRHTRGATPGILGALASEAAWRDGDTWLDLMIAYLDERRHQFAGALPRLPGVGCSLPEATYLAWLDLRATSFASEPVQRLRDCARVQLSDGTQFGASGFARLNLALPEAVLNDVLDRLAEAFQRG